MITNSFEFKSTEIEATEKRLNDRLKDLLTQLYLLEISKQTCIRLGNEAIRKVYNRMLSTIDTDISGQGFTTAPSIVFKKYLGRVKRDWSKIVSDAEVFVRTEEPDGKILHRLSLLAWFLTYSIFNHALVHVAKSELGARLEWVIMVNPPTPVCDVCLALAGFYLVNTHLPEMPQHYGCRCRWKLWIIIKDM